jgi:hypothetical protein
MAKNLQISATTGLLVATDAEDTLDQHPFCHEVDIHYQSTGMATKSKAPNFYT